MSEVPSHYNEVNFQREMSIPVAASILSSIFFESPWVENSA